MRKTILLLLAVILALTVACSRGDTAAQATNAPAPTGDLSALAASDTDTVAAQAAHMPPASATDAVVNSERFQLAYSYIGRPAAELVASIGAPPEPIEYTPSALQEGAMDGSYHYDGFYVISLHTDEEELIRDVYPDSWAPAAVVTPEPADTQAEQPAEAATPQPANG